MSWSKRGVTSLSGVHQLFVCALSDVHIFVIGIYSRYVNNIHA